MGYQKQGFYSGQPLKASQLDAMEEGIINAEKLAMEAAAGAANMEKGNGEKGTVNGTQQVLDGATLDFTGKNSNAALLDTEMTGVLINGATGNWASSFGGKGIAIGKRSMAQGTTTVAKGSASHSEGDNTVALGADSHAEGYATVSKGEHSHSEGISTITEGANSHAEGSQTKAVGYASHAEGDRCEAIGVCSHAGGALTIAGHDYQTVVGMFNDNKSDTLFEVGNGSSDDNRSNAFEVRNDGTVAIKYNGQKYSLQKILEALSAFVDSAKLTD